MPLECPGSEDGSLWTWDLHGLTVRVHLRWPNCSIVEVSVHGDPLFPVPSCGLSPPRPPPLVSQAPRTLSQCEGSRHVAGHVTVSFSCLMFCISKSPGSAPGFHQGCGGDRDDPSPRSATSVSALRSFPPSFLCHTTYCVSSSGANKGPWTMTAMVTIYRTY